MFFNINLTVNYELFFSGFFNLFVYWKIFTITFLFLTFINSSKGLFFKIEFKNFDFRLSLFSLIFSVIFLVLSLFLWLVNFGKSYWYPKIKIDEALVSSPVLNFETTIFNFLSLLMVSIGWSLHRKVNKSFKKFIRIFVFYLLGLLILTIRF